MDIAPKKRIKESAARRRKRLANSSLRWIKRGTAKLVSGLGPSATLRRTRRVITDNFTTSLAPASRVLDLRQEILFPPTLFLLFSYFS